MLFLGVLSVFQLLFFPGLLLIRLFPGKRSVIQNSVYVFMLSLLANYAIVFLLVGVGLYFRAIVLPLFALELAAVVWVYRKSLLSIFESGKVRLKTSVSTSIADWVKKDFRSAGLYYVFGVIAVLGLLWVLWVWLTNLTTVYQAWDSWASWDPWAVGWAENRFPENTWEYPQLIPVSFSVAYKFIGTIAVKFFGKSIMPLFALVIGLMLFDLGRRFRSFGYMLGAGLAIYSIDLFMGNFLPEAYVDVPVACFSLMAIYTLLSAHKLRNKQELRSALLLGSLAAVAAAVTKQTGLYILAFYPLLAYLWILRINRAFKSREIFAMLGVYVLLVVILVAPWYILMEYRMVTGGNSSNIQYVITDIYKGQTLVERFLSAIDSMGRYVYVYVFALASILVLDTRFRQILLFLVLPFSILWAFFLSYEFRNLAVALPLLAMTVGVATETWTARIHTFLARSKKFCLPAYSFGLIGFALLGVYTLAISEERLVQRQISQQRQIFQTSLNEKLYEYIDQQPVKEKIITNYPVGWLPGLEGRWINDRFQDYDKYLRSLQNHAEVTLLLVPMITGDPRIIDEVMQNLDGNIYELIFTEANYMLIRIPSR